MKIPRVHQSHGRWYRSVDTEERLPNGKRRQKWVPLTRVDEGEQALMRALADNISKFKNEKKKKK